MLKMGYQIGESDTRKYPTIRSVNAKKATRLYHLGEDYLPNAIRKRIWMNPPSVKVEWARFQYPAQAAEAKQYRCRGSVREMRRLTGLQALFFIFGCLIGVYPANAPPQRRRKPLSPEMKEACRRLDRFTQQVTLLSRQRLRTEEDVKDFIASSGSELDTLLKARRKLYDKVSRADSEQEKDAIRQKYGDYTQRITELRRDIRTAERILADEPKLRECIAAEKEVRRLQRQLEAPQKKIQRNRGYER
ncbi:MAG: hypothetical protein LUH51_08120 [Firmicutes bacterium]|nr:hypothetical protein [Bacillota bacterium]